MNHRIAEPGWRGAARLAALAVVYAIACRVMLAPICNFAHLPTASYEGDARLIIWTLAWDNHAVADGVRRLFDANTFYPARDALAYSEHLIGISLFTLPVYVATRNPVLAYNLVWILSFLLSAAAAHLLAWRQTRDHLAATMAGLAYAFCFYRMHQGHGHLHVIWGFWIPVSLIAMERWVRRPAWGRLAAFVAIVVLQALASWYQAVLIFVANALFMAWLVIVERAERGEPADRARVSRLAVQAMVGAIVALAIVWPFARHYGALGGGGPAEAAGGAADLTGYLTPPENTFIGQWMIGRGIKGPRWIWGEQTLYLGWVALALAIVGAAASIRGKDPIARRGRFFIVLAIAAVALALGPSGAEVATNSWGWSPFGILAHIPGVSLFRVPARFTDLVTLAVALLAAAGCATMHARVGRLGRVLTLVAMPLFLAESYVVNFPGGAPPVFPIPPVYRFIASLPPGPVVSLPDYAGTPVWFEEANYQYFSTAHWHPIANGYSRSEPPGFRTLMARLQTFPEPAAAAAMRDAGITYVVVHAAKYPVASSDVAARAGASQDFRLIARFENDYVFAIVRPGASP